MSLLFEDLFKKFNADLKRQADLVMGGERGGGGEMKTL